MIKQPVQISRDPFGRYGVMRMLATNPQECAWCAQHARWLYGIERDDRPGRILWDNRPYCSVGCWRDFHAT